MNELPPPYPGRPTTADAEHLKLLAIFHYIVGGLAILGIGFLFFHYLIFSSVVNSPQFEEGFRKSGGNQQIDPRQFFAMFKWFYLVFGFFCALAAVINFLSGWFIHKRINRMFSLIVAGFNCLQVPFGTALGVFTLIVLLRDSVRALYQAPRT